MKEKKQREKTRDRTEIQTDKAEKVRIGRGNATGRIGEQ